MDALEAANVRIPRTWTAGQVCRAAVGASAAAFGVWLLAVWCDVVGGVSVLAVAILIGQDG
ncbi:hypothetical protein [Nocardia sp. NPDC004860]|uniref:hypothetical protein n=1 Tax=Nocardia sp. NPDC004860 TaxID=3154557 RepID=UPI0033A24D74